MCSWPHPHSQLWKSVKVMGGEAGRWVLKAQSASCRADKRWSLPLQSLHFGNSDSCWLPKITQSKPSLLEDIFTWLCHKNLCFQESIRESNLLNIIEDQIQKNETKSLPTQPQWEKILCKEMTHLWSLKLSEKGKSHRSFTREKRERGIVDQSVLPS